MLGILLNNKLIPILRLSIKRASYTKMETNKNYNRADLLWKAIIEDFIVEVIDYFYPKIEKERAKDQPIEFLDKFLQTLHPEAVEGNRRADLLVKVPLVNGKEKWILLHVEVQGYEDKDLPRRMFTYYHRSLDRFGVPVEALVIFTDTNKRYRPSHYEYKGIKTRCLYAYNTFKLADYSMSDFEKVVNPVGIIFQTALIGMQRNLKDGELLTLKTTLYRKLLSKGYEKEKVGYIGIFIRDLIHFKKPEFNDIFVEEVNKIEQKNRAMGVIETVKKYTREEGLAIGVFIANLKGQLDLLKKFKDRNFSLVDLSEIIDQEEAFVKDFKKGYTEGKYKQLLISIEKSKRLEDMYYLGQYLIPQMFAFGFTKPVLAKYFKKTKKEIVEILKNID